MKPFLVIIIAATLLPVTAAAQDSGIWPACWRLLDQDKYISSANMEELPWQEIRKQRKLRSTANQDPKRLLLQVLTDRDDPDTAFRPFGDADPATASAFFRDPNGEVRALGEITGADGPVSLPPDEELIGRYLLGAHVVLETPEPVHLCAKHLVTHYKAGGTVGSASVVFFDDPSRMPLEIGPVIDTAKSRYGGGTQRAHRSYEMMVKYKNAPLGNASVTIIAEGSGWRQALVTDENGIFKVTPTDDRALSGDWQRYLYVATHRDQATGETYVATMPAVIYKNRPEWRSKTVGFVFWSVIGCGLCILGIWGHVRRKQWRVSRHLAVFNNHRAEG
jgi:hypothetical protein